MIGAPLLAAAPDLAHRSPTHEAQAVIRLLLAVCCALAIPLELELPFDRALATCASLPLILAYVPAAVLYLAWSLALGGNACPPRRLHLRLGVALVTDVFIVAGFTATSEHYAPLSLPIFIWIIAGYGWSFGAVYAVAASGLCMLAFALCAPLNPLFELGSVASVGAYLCFLATPLYVLQVLGAPRHMPPQTLAAAGPGWPVACAVSPTWGAGEPEKTSPLLDDALLAELKSGCGDTGSWQALVREFETEALGLLASAAEAAERDDHARLAFDLHRLKGAAAAMAAARLASLVARLEADPAPRSCWREARTTLVATVRLLQETT